MTLKQLLAAVLFETGNDADDLGDFQPHLTDYINEGYDRLVKAFTGEHVSEESENYPPLVHEKSQPCLPSWAHRAIADYAAWMIYRNGSVQKQSRGHAFLRSFEEATAKLRNEAGRRSTSSAGGRFTNIPW